MFILFVARKQQIQAEVFFRHFRNKSVLLTWGQKLQDLKQLMHYLVRPPQADDQHLLKVEHLLSLTACRKRKRHYLLKSFKPCFIPYLWKAAVWRTKEITASPGRQSTLDIRPAFWKMDRRPMPLPASAKPRVPGREVCENTKSGSPDATAAEAQSVRRGLHLMPDCPNLPQNSGLNSPGRPAAGLGEQEMETGRHSNCTKVCWDFLRSGSQ